MAPRSNPVPRQHSETSRATSLESGRDTWVNPKVPSLWRSVPSLCGSKWPACHMLDFSDTESSVQVRTELFPHPSSYTDPLAWTSMWWCLYRGWKRAWEERWSVDSRDGIGAWRWADRLSWERATDGSRPSTSPSRVSGEKTFWGQDSPKLLRFSVSQGVRRCLRLFTAPSLWFRAISLVYSFSMLLKERLLDSLCRCTYLCVDTCAKYSTSTLHCLCHFLLMSACIQCCLLPVLQFDVAHCLTLSALDCMHGQGGTVWGFVFFSFALLAVWYFGWLWCLFCDICS